MTASACRRLQPRHDAAEHRGRHLSGAATAAHRLLARLGPHLRQFAIAPHPAPVDPVLEPPQIRPLGGEGPARGDGMPVAGADQGQPAALRHGAPQPLAGERAAQIGGERRALADGVDPGFLARMGDHRRDIAGREDARIAGRAQGLVDRDKAARRSRAAQSRRAMGPHPPRSPTAPRRNRSAGRRRRSARQARPERPRCRSARRSRARRKSARTNGRTRRLCDGSNASRVMRATSSGAAPSPASRYWADKRQLDTAGAAADDGEPQPPHLSGAGQQGFPALRQNGRSV